MNAAGSIPLYSTWTRSSLSPYSVRAWLATTCDTASARSVHPAVARSSARTAGCGRYRSCRWIRALQPAIRAALRPTRIPFWPAACTIALRSRRISHSTSVSARESQRPRPRKTVRHPALRSASAAGCGSRRTQAVTWTMPGSRRGRTERQYRVRPCVTPHQDLAWEEVGVEGMDLGDVRERIVADSRRPFDLSTGPLFRVSLYTRAEDDRILLLTVHHSVFDARSMAVAFDESITMYPAFRRGRAPRLPPATSYSDFARRQADFVDSPDGERLARYWLDRLAGELPILELPTHRPRPSVQTLRGGTVEVQLPPSLTSAVMEVAHAERVTPFVIYLSALQVVLQRYSGQSEILIGTPTRGRTRPEFQRGIGYYVNPVVLRGDLSGSPTFRTLLGRTRTTVLEALAHQDYPFNLLVQRLGLAADRSRPPVFQVMFNYLNVAPLMVGRGLAGDGSATIEIAGLKIEGFPIPTQEGQFDLALEIVQAGPLTTAVLRYDSDLFDRETIERMAGHYRTLLEAAVQDPSTPI